MGFSFSKFVSLFRHKDPIRILIVGLDAAGKTTALYNMKLGEVVSTIPTIGLSVETAEYKNIALTAWDVGGRCKIRPLWRHYYQATNGLVFFVDSNDRDRFPEVCKELESLMSEEELQNKPVLVFANKQDLPHAASVVELKEKLNLEKLLIHRKWHIEPAVASQGEGLLEGFEWLSKAMTSQNADMTKPFMETANDSKILKDSVLSMFDFINHKLLFSKVT